ncbi:hypothetical protein [Methylobacterium haplocladii]|uniref:hypothetical protein n=1 Tax=Methylobacterium haplocladii TaxID=1176176 RepID=UPI0024E15415|nr:hypothetical protein [Methylobacterium haplocladii]
MRLLVVLPSAMLSVALPLLLLASPQAGRPVLVIAAPWLSPAETAGTIEDAGGALLRGTPFPWAAVAVSDGADFAAKLRRAGAWITLDASRVPGCLNAAPV